MSGFLMRLEVDLHHANFSISLEISEVMNVQLYDEYRGTDVMALATTSLAGRVSEGADIFWGG